MTREITLPPSMYISRSKTVIETISLIADFRDFLTSGETVSTKAVAIEVFTGTDPDPENMFYLGLFANGAVLEQRFRLGIPGVIYSILFSITTSNGNAYDITTRLAVLPNLGSATPVFNSIYITSSLYPYYFYDGISSDVTFLSGKLLGIKYFDSFSSSVSFVSGGIVGTFIYYPIPPDGMESSITWTAGAIGGTIKNYAIPSDKMTSGVFWLQGLIGGTALSYAIPPDSLDSSISWFSGSLI